MVAAQAGASRAPRRWAAGLLGSAHAIAFAVAAAVIPWRAWPAFPAGAAALAALHLAAAALALAPHRLAPRALRLASFASLLFLGYLVSTVVSSAVYVASLNRGLGAGVALQIATGLGVVALFTLPFAAWGVAVTGGIRFPKAALAALAALALAALALAFAGNLAWQDRIAKADPLPVPGGAVDRVPAILREALAGVAEGPSLLREPVSLLTTAPARCAAPPGPGRLTVVLTFLARPPGSRAAAPVTRCVQPGPGEDAAAALRAAVAEARPGPVKIDVLSAAQPLRSPGPGLEGLALRPGLDGVCLADRCLMPWQLISLDLFQVPVLLAGVRMVPAGFVPAEVRKALGEAPPMEGLEDLVRVEVMSYVLDDDGSLQLLSRFGQPARALTPETLADAAAAAQQYIVEAQRDDGMFSYTVDPFTGKASFEGFNIARQAGTTLVLCELGDPAVAREPARRSLALLASLEQPIGGAPPDRPASALVHPRGAKARTGRLTPAALTLIALLSCRSLAGPDHDALIGRLARMALAVQRPDGSFAPEIEMAPGTQEDAPALYEGGQAMFALILLEALATREPSPAWPAAAEVRAAVERGMDHFAHRYWRHFAADFLFLEEHWHCLAARAALPHHRHEGYERFCLDYVAWKTQSLLDDRSAVQDDFRGGLGSSNVSPPLNTPTASTGEALAAAMALKQARGEDLERERARMRDLLSFLLRHQWTRAGCFACARNARIEGAWSLHMAAPQIRIDFVQHAWAALGHGGRALGESDDRKRTPDEPYR